MIPACLLGGIVLSKFFKNLDVKPPAGLFQERQFSKDQLPGLGISILCAVIPIILMLSGALVDLLFGIPPLNADLKKQGFENITSFYHYLLMNKGLPVNVSAIGSHLLSFIKFFSDANMALFLAVLFGLYALGIRRGRSMNDLMKTFGQAVAAISMILLLIGGGGAFSQVLNDGHLTDYIRTSCRTTKRDLT
jgi:H+/gluconate symporter-like permease